MSKSQKDSFKIKILFEKGQFFRVYRLNKGKIKIIHVFAGFTLNWDCE